MKLFQEYIEALQEHEVSTVTEHTYRSALEKLLKEIAATVDKNIKVQHEPKRQEGFGAPDFKIKSVEAIIGYVENKKLKEDLSKTVKSDQIKKYKTLSGNILVTNYIEWAWIKDGELIDQVKLCDIDQIECRMAFVLDRGKVEQVKAMLTNFYRQTPKGIGKPKPLAEALAIRARYLRDFLHIELIRQENEHQEGRLYGLYDTFKINVFHELTQKEFADAFSQTLVYGLFLSKLNADTKTIDLYNAKQYILPAFGLISELVDFLDELEKNHYRDARWIVEEILSVMNTLDLRSIAKNLSYEKFKSTNLFDENKISYKDPYIYFYEHFLAAYDKKLRKAKGVYYTPPQVVNFIVRSLNDILKDTFGIEKGFADKEKVTVLDFATGTGTFLLEILEIIFEELPKGSGKKNLLIKDHILKNFYGFEYMIAPYAVANLKLSQFLKEQGYDLIDNDRFQIYLTNTLEPVNPQTKMPLLPALSKEAREAQKIKDNPILVITGNPPYAGHSRNPSELTYQVTTKSGKVVNRKKKTWIGNLIDDYRFVDGQPLGEKNPKWLQDDYVKFMRFAQSKMDQVEEGVVGIITNHRFISNPTFRGMRKSLMDSFDQIHILDLHGSNKPREFAPNGGPDENVFDVIQQGVAITFLIKKPGIEKKVVHADLYGKRIEKYDFCLQQSRKTVNYNQLTPDSPFFLFLPQDKEFKNSYHKGIPIKEIFDVSGNGMTTAHDAFVMGNSISEIAKRFVEFKNSARDVSVLHENFKVKKKEGWDILTCWDVFQKFTEAEIIHLIHKVAYRPFDKQFIIYEDNVVWRTVKSVLENMLTDNVAIVVGRAGQNVSATVDWNLAFVTDCISDFNLFFRGGGFVCPLNKQNVVRDSTKVKQISAFEIENPTRQTNFTARFLNKIEGWYGEIEHETIFGYIYMLFFTQ